MSAHKGNGGGLRKLAELIQNVRVAMMQTLRGSVAGPADLGNVHIRPMYTQKVDPETFAGQLFFFTDRSSVKVDELEANPAVILTYASPNDERYVVVKGEATCERDFAKARELWNIHAKGWWPDGPTSSELMVIRVQVTDAEYWDGPSKFSYAIKLLSAIATGARIEAYGDHGKL